MIELSTPALNPVASKKLKKGACDSDDLDEGEQAFYYAIKKDLNVITEDPSNKTIDNILRYSRSF